MAETTPMAATTEPAGLTPLMRQYQRAKREYQDAILFFRLGDFYEMFGDDARIASKILDLVLTKRQDTPMCGVPYHASTTYIARLLKEGHKVAICEQVSGPDNGESGAPGRPEGKGLFRREVVRVITPGTVVEEALLRDASNNFLAVVCPDDRPADSGLPAVAGGPRLGVALADLSTGEFYAAAAGGEADLELVLSGYRVGEAVLPLHGRGVDHLRDWFTLRGIAVNTLESGPFLPERAREILLAHFSQAILEPMNLGEEPAMAGACGALLAYLAKTGFAPAGGSTQPAFHRIARVTVGDHLVMDEHTARALEILECASDAKPGCLADVLDRTVTSMGARLLRRWLRRPLVDAGVIALRQDLVEACLKPDVRRQVRESLGGLGDLERAISRLNSGSASPRDMASLKASLARVPAVAAALRQLAFGAAEVHVLHQEYLNALADFQDLVDLLHRALVDSPPMTLREGGFIKPGYHPELDALRNASTEGKQYLAHLEARERERTGIASLKVGYNNVYGYYLEVTKPNLPHVPPDYERKQTLVNAERFVTPELKEREALLLGAEERAARLEGELFQDLRQTAVRRTAEIQGAARALAAVDALQSLAEVAAAYGYVRPVMSAPGGPIRITDGRHPVVERTPAAAGRFVPNDTELLPDGQRVLIITGPNMAGKSTYLRQVALLTVMAQSGSFVPAASAEIGVVDRIFTRIGAGDALAEGASTFMVEMRETATILAQATPRSLVILDEVGRGTSTFDGISIAWAVVEDLAARVRARTLFATHYFELTELADVLPMVRNYAFAVREWQDDIIFLRRLVPGCGDKSYGIHVAKLAGLPPAVVTRARAVLAELEAAAYRADGRPRLAGLPAEAGGESRPQLPLFKRDAEGGVGGNAKP